MPAKRKRTQRSAALRTNYEHRIFGDVLSMAATIAENRKQTVSQRLAELAKATKDFSSAITDLPILCDYSKAAAKGLEKLAKYVDRRDVTDILNDIAALTRRQPVATIALGVAAGLIATQLLRNVPVSTRSPTSMRRNSTAKAERKHNRSGGLRRRLRKKNQIAAAVTPKDLTTTTEEQSPLP
jgi:hypothetical protein